MSPIERGPNQSGRGFAAGIMTSAIMLLCTVSSTWAQDDANGLQAVFYATGFDGTERPCGVLDGPETFTEIHPVLSIGWSGAPRAGFCASNYRVRWSGYLTAPEAGRYYISYTFRGVNGSIRVGDAVFAGRKYGRPSGGWVDLDPAEPVSIIAEVKSFSTGTNAHLKWMQEGDDDLVVIPTEALTPEMPTEDGLSTVFLAERDSIVVEGAYDGNVDAARNTSDTFGFMVHRTPPFTDPLVVHLDYGGDAEMDRDFGVWYRANLALGNLGVDDPTQIIIPAGASLVYLQGGARTQDLTHQGDRRAVIRVVDDDTYQVGTRDPITIHILDDDFPPGHVDQVPEVPIPDTPGPELLGEGQEDEVCVTDLDFFASAVWRGVLEPRCSGCHQGGGSADRSSMRYDVAGDTADIRRANLAVFRELAPYRWRDMPLLLAKPLGLGGHGGGQILDEADPAVEVLQAMITRSLGPPEDCVDRASPEQQIFESVEFLGPRGTFRRAAQRLAKRLPTTAELQLIEDGGWAGFDDALARLLAGEDFNHHFAALWEARLQAGLPYLRSFNMRLDTDQFPYDRWASGPGTGFPENLDVAQQLFDRALGQIKQEPTAIVRHILRNRRPFGELLTADYTVMNGYLARLYGVFDELEDQFQNSLDPFEDLATRIPDFPHAGILTTPFFMIRHAGYRGDRNRTRAEAVLRLFGNRFDLSTSAATMDLRALAHNPTANDVQCSGCHGLMDSTAGLFRNWTPGGGYVRDSDWFEEMPQPGLRENILPRARRRESVRWLAQQIVGGEGFSRAMAHHVYRILLERAPLAEPLGDEPFAEAYDRVYRAQQAFLERAATVFEDHDQDIRTLIKAVVKSPWYRADGYAEEAAQPVGARRFELDQMGRYGVMEPMTLNMKLTVTTGLKWQEGNTRIWKLGPRSLPFYYAGGWDSLMGGDRNSKPSSLAVNTYRAAANRVGCERIPYEFWLMSSRPEQARLLLPFVSDDTSLFDEDGEIVPEVAEAVRDNLRYLMAWLWDQPADDGDPDLEELFEYFVETARDGQERLWAEEESDELYTYCRATFDYDADQAIPWQEHFKRDPNYMVRTWMAVLYVFLTDHLFVLEGGE